jgi:hypothetical protein
MYKLLARERSLLTFIDADQELLIKQVAIELGDSEPGLVHALWLLQDVLAGGSVIVDFDDKLSLTILQSLKRLGLSRLDADRFKLSDSGREFLMRLLVEKGSDNANRLVGTLRSNMHH